MKLILEFLTTAFSLVLDLFKKHDENAIRDRIIRLADRRMRQKDRLERLKQRTTKSGTLPGDK